MVCGSPATALLEAAWSAAATDQTGWTILDTGLDAQRTLEPVLAAWRACKRRPRLLHYVGLLPAGTRDFPSLNLTHLDDGFHRVLCDSGLISVTLCVGNPIDLLDELRVQADSILADERCAQWDKWWMKSLARCCKAAPSATRLHFPAGAMVDAQVLQDSGFQRDAVAADACPTATYAPLWQPKTSRRNDLTSALPVGRCAVVGAGLSGASIAHALALRGWQVTVYDRESEPALGASGLPAGLVVPHVSADDSPRSRLSRRGSRLMLSQARELLRDGQDFCQTGVQELRGEGVRLWHAQAGWIKPASLVRAWLAHDNITFTGNAAVAGLRRTGSATGTWTLQDAGGQPLGSADVVVLANAAACAELIRNLAPTVELDPDLPGKLAALQQLHGTLSCGTHADVAQDLHCAELPDHPVNGNGSLLTGVPDDASAATLQWFAGATYETDLQRIADEPGQHRTNAQKLLELLPDAGQRLMPAFAQGQVRAWSSTRCVTHDRMPLVGPLVISAQPSLWLCAGMGSRGLSFAALCAELLAARMGAEPWPVEATLARGLDANRQRRRKAAAKG